VETVDNVILQFIQHITKEHSYFLLLSINREGNGSAGASHRVPPSFPTLIFHDFSMTKNENPRPIGTTDISK